MDRELFKVKAAMLGYTELSSKEPPSAEKEDSSQEGESRIEGILATTKKHLELE